MTAQIFGNAGIEYMEKYGAKPEHFAEIARINHAHRYLLILPFLPARLPSCSCKWY